MVYVILWSLKFDGLRFLSKQRESLEGIASTWHSESNNEILQRVDGVTPLRKTCIRNKVKITVMSEFLITDVRIFDGQVIIDRGSVLVSGGKITKVSSTPIGSDGPTISKPGHTLLPGLIDAHVHVDFGNESGLSQGLRFGVTTQCDLGNAPFQVEKLRSLVKEGDCSDIKAAMQSATAEGGWPTPLLKVTMRQI